MEDAKTKLQEKAKDYFGPRIDAYRLFRRLLLGNLVSFLGGGILGSLAEILVGGTSIAIIISALVLAFIAAAVTMLITDALEIDKWLDAYKIDIKKCDDDFTKALRERGPVFRKG